MANGERLAIGPLRRMLGMGRRNRNEEHAGTARPLLSTGKTSAEPWFAFKTLRGEFCHRVVLFGDKTSWKPAPSLIEQPSLITSPVNLSQNERAQR